MKLEADLKEKEELLLIKDNELEIMQKKIDELEAADSHVFLVKSNLYLTFYFLKSYNDLIFPS